MFFVIVLLFLVPYQSKSASKLNSFLNYTKTKVSFIRKKNKNESI